MRYTRERQRDRERKTERPREKERETESNRQRNIQTDIVSYHITHISIRREKPARKWENQIRMRDNQPMVIGTSSAYMVFAQESSVCRLSAYQYPPNPPPPYPFIGIPPIGAPYPPTGAP